jgi:hypothetical protein
MNARALFNVMELVPKSALASSLFSGPSAKPGPPQSLRGGGT